MIDYKKTENLKFKTCYSKRTLSKSSPFTNWEKLL